MAKYLARSCLRCGDYFGVIISQMQNAIKAVCLRCSYYFTWTIITGGGTTKDNDK
jgi:DNA-directed RNA polymerase subunit RPC12/RpoP